MLLTLTAKCPIPGFLVDFLGAADFRDSHVVVQDVDASEFTQAPVDQRLDGLRTRDVRFMSLAFTAFLVDDPAGFLGGRRVAVNGKHARTLARIQNGRCLTVSPARTNRTSTGHEGDLIFDSQRHNVF